LARRAIALILLALGLAFVGWVTFAVAGGIRGKSEPKPKPTPIVAAPTLKIIFPEGFTRAQMAERIKAVNQIARRKRKINPKLSPRAYLGATASSKIPGRVAGDHKRRQLEGFLFPSTYDFEQTTTSRQLVNRQLQAFQENWGKVDLAYAKSKNLTPYDVLIIASIIEKEVIAPEERPLVAAVIYNRLHAHMALGIDATLRYGLHIPPTESLTQSELHDPTPYNTRVHDGLPPTPINNPGIAALEAAANPAKVDYLYFVRKPDHKHHYFTANYQDFLQHEAQYGY
jgi:UPF0755 protein